MVELSTSARPNKTFDELMQTFAVTSSGCVADECLQTSPIASFVYLTDVALLAQRVKPSRSLSKVKFFFVQGVTAFGRCPCSNSLLIVDMIVEGQTQASQTLLDRSFS